MSYVRRWGGNWRWCKSCSSYARRDERFCGNCGKESTAFGTDNKAGNGKGSSKPNAWQHWDIYRAYSGRAQTGPSQSSFEISAKAQAIVQKQQKDAGPKVVTIAKNRFDMPDDDDQPDEDQPVKWISQIVPKPALNQWTMCEALTSSTISTKEYAKTMETSRRSRSLRTSIGRRRGQSQRAHVARRSVEPPLGAGSTSG